MTSALWISSARKWSHCCWKYSYNHCVNLQASHFSTDVDKLEITEKSDCGTERLDFDLFIHYVNLSAYSETIHGLIIRIQDVHVQMTDKSKYIVYCFVIIN
jgi:hypothetical protein